MATDWKSALMEELKGNKALLQMGEQDSGDSSGSDDDPSEDDLPPKIMAKILPNEKSRRISPQRKEKFVRPPALDSPRRRDKDRPAEDSVPSTTKGPLQRGKSPVRFDRKFPLQASVIGAATSSVRSPVRRDILTKRGATPSALAAKEDSERPALSSNEEEKKVDGNAKSAPAVPMFDAFTQTEKADFQKAK